MKEHPKHLGHFAIFLLFLEALAQLNLSSQKGLMRVISYMGLNVQYDGVLFMAERETIEKVKEKQGILSKIQNFFTLGYGTKEDLRELNRKLRDNYYADTETCATYGKTYT